MLLSRPTTLSRLHATLKTWMMTTWTHLSARAWYRDIALTEIHGCVLTCRYLPVSSQGWSLIVNMEIFLLVRVAWTTFACGWAITPQHIMAQEMSTATQPPRISTGFLHTSTPSHVMRLGNTSTASPRTPCHLTQIPMSTLQSFRFFLSPAHKFSKVRS